ncbi:MAG: hypothetical protein P4L99_25560 [Chthoniobacter sp.]|nr:hypothetical protein [Chthoniobacter sp.]
MNNGRASIDWRGAALAMLLLSLHGAAWLLSHGGRLMQCGGEHLRAVGAALNPATPERRRK